MDKIFEQFRNESLNQLKNLRPDDVEIFKDTPFNPSFLSLNLSPGKKTLKKIEEVVAKIKKLDRDQFFMPTPQIHLTLLGKINKKTDREKIINSVSQTLLNYQLEFDILGIGSNKHVSSFSCYPKNFSLFDLRKELREKIGDNGDSYSKILPSYEYVGWLNYMRYFHRPDQALLDELYALRDLNLGTMTASKIGLYEVFSPSVRIGQTRLIYLF